MVSPASTDAGWLRAVCRSHGLLMLPLPLGLPVVDTYQDDAANAGRTPPRLAAAIRTARQTVTRDRFRPIYSPPILSPQDVRHGTLQDWIRLSKQALAFEAKLR